MSQASPEHNNEADFRSTKLTRAKAIDDRVVVGGDGSAEAVAVATDLLDVAREAHGGTRRRISEVGVNVRDVHSRLSTIAGIAESQDRLIVLRIVVQGPTSRIPIVWQHVGDGAADALRGALSAIEMEIQAALEALPLPATVDCPVVLAPELAAQIAHEAIGHTSEADNYVEYAEPAGFKLGYRWSEFPLTIVDDPTIPGLRGSFGVDHDGVPSHRRVLVDKGVWADLLVNGEWSKRLGLLPGNGRRVPFAESSLPRMSTTFLEAGEAEVGDLIAGVREGIYCRGTWSAGSVGMDCIIRPAWGERIRDGRLTGELVRRFDIVSEKAALVGAIDAVGNDFVMQNPAFGCDKYGQNGLGISMGAPHVRLTSVQLSPN